MVFYKINLVRSIRDAHKKRAEGRPYWRPTVAVVLVDDQDRVLVVHSTGRSTWWFPKGGIETNDLPRKKRRRQPRVAEGLFRAALRELEEELFIKEQHLTHMRYLGSALGQNRPITAQNGATRLGKHFHFVTGVLSARARPHPNRQHHVDRFVWVTSREDCLALEMNIRRREIFWAALKAAGVAWAQT